MYYVPNVSPMYPIHLVNSTYGKLKKRYFVYSNKSQTAKKLFLIIKVRPEISESVSIKGGI